MNTLKNYSRRFIAAGIMINILIIFSCCIDTPDNITAADAPEIDIDIAWQIPAESPGGGFNSLFSGKYMYYVSNPTDQVYTVDLENKSIIRISDLPSSANPVKNGDHIFIPNDWYIDGYPILYFSDAAGNLIGKIPLEEKYSGWSFDLFSHGNYIYWCPFYDGKQSVVRLDTSTISHIGGEEYSADVQLLYPPGENILGAYPTFYNGKVYMPVDDSGFSNPTRILIFNETTGILEKELVLSEFVGASQSVEVFLSGTTGLVSIKKVNIETGKVIPRSLRVSCHFAPYTFIGNYGYASSSAQGGTGFTSLWKLNMDTLEVEWYYQHEYSLGTQPQVVDGIVYVTAPDMILLFDADTGKILAKDTDLKGHPIQHANSYIYNGQMIFHDGYNITAIKTNWKKTSCGGVEKVE